MITLDEQTQVQKWLEDEKNGEQFPVDFNIAWVMAGYALKHHAKRRIETDLSLGTDFIFPTQAEVFTKSGEWAKGGRPSELIQLTCDGFKHFCLLAKTEKGRAIRQYFIETEKLVKDKMIPHVQLLTKRIEELETELANQKKVPDNGNVRLALDIALKSIEILTNELEIQKQNHINLNMGIIWQLAENSKTTK